MTLFPRESDATIRSVWGTALLSGRPDIVDLEDHLDQLCREEQLALLGVETLNHALLLHVVLSLSGAVHTQGGIALGDLLGLNLSDRVDGLESRVLGQRHRD